MTESAIKEYCGPTGLGFHNIVSIKNKNMIYSYFEGSNVIYVHKGRTAIKIACELLGLGPDSEVLTPSYNCGSEIDALLSTGTSVVLYRVNRDASIDITNMESKITNRTKAVYITHYFGFTHSLEFIKKICANYNLYLIEDCALSLFSHYGDKMIGTIGDLTIFSLPKTLPVPDGGILLINNPIIQGNPLILSQPDWFYILINTLPSLKASLMRWLFQNPSLIRLYKTFTDEIKSDFKDNIVPSSQVRKDMPQSYYYIDRYSNKDMSSFTKYLIKNFNPDEIQEKRRRNYIVLGLMLKKNPCFATLYKELPDQICPLNYPLFVEKRDAMVQKLNQQQIDAKAWWRGYHKMLPWQEFPDACYLKDNIMTLPVHQDLSETALEYIADCVNKLMQK